MTEDDIFARTGASPVLALAPMQDVTDLPFWKLMTAYGGADVYYTEYFRVHPVSHLESHIRRSITENPTGRPVVAQMIGNDIPSLVNNAKLLQELPIVAVDLNLGCPAPVVYRKCAGGGLLRDLPQVDAILGALREVINVRFTVKTRVGFDHPATFDALLPILQKHSLDLLTVHGRTVKEMYWSEVRYDLIQRAAEVMPCPVLANGNISTAARALEVWRETGARGLMLGRGAIRNPWIFQQVRQLHAGDQMFLPAGRDVLAYIEALYEAVCEPDIREASQVQKMKKYMNFIGAGVEPSGQFLHQIRRCQTRIDFFSICREFLDHEHPLTLQPFPENRALNPSSAPPVIAY